MLNKRVNGLSVEVGPMQPALFILSGVVRAIAKEPESVHARLRDQGTCSTVVLEVSPLDFALLHEREGATIVSLRTVAAALSVRLKSEILIEIQEMQESETTDSLKNLQR